MKTNKNNAGVAALQKWREEHTNRDGKLIGISRKTAAQILEIKKAKLMKLESKVNELRSQIAKIDASINRDRIKVAIKGYTAEEIEAALAAIRK